MRLLLWNIFLSLIWMALTSLFAPANFIIGLVLGFGVLWLSEAKSARANYFMKFRQVVSFVVHLAWDLILSSLRVAYNVVTPVVRTKPGVIAIALNVKTDAEILVLANAITLTPGTMSLDVSADRKTLYVHGMFIEDPELFRAEIKDGIERRTLELMR